MTPNPPKDLRLPALRRFATAISILTLLGQTVLGFEPGWIHVVAAIGTAYSMEAMLEFIDARFAGRPYAWQGGGLQRFVDFFLPGHITALACAMLLYAGDRVFPVMFGVAVGIGSKALLRVPVGKGRRHFLNPSNTGIAMGLLVVPWTGPSPPYQFTEHLTGAGDWILPAIIVCSGTFLNGRFTRKLPLIGGWLGGFVVQGLLRWAILGTRLFAPITQMTGVAFVLFTNYMVSDPATTPTIPRRQVLFGASVALVYGAMRAFHIYWAIFFALFVVCTARGLYCIWAAAAERAAQSAGTVPSLIPSAPPTDQKLAS